MGRAGRRHRVRATRPGTRARDRVGLLFENDRWAEYAVAFLGVLRAGGVAVPLPARQSEATLRLMIDDCQARWVLDQALHDTRRTRADDPDVQDPQIDPGRPKADPGADSTAGPRVEPDNEKKPTLNPDDPAQILYTSGTTGRPKGVAASHANLAFGHRPHPAHRMLSHSEYFLHAFPIGTNAAQMMLVNTLVAHPTALVASVFDAERFCAAIAERRVGTVFVVPSMAADLLSSEAWRRHDLSSVLLLSSSADALPPHVASALPRAFPKATIVNFYTSTEAVPAQTTMIVDPARPHSVGRATESGDLRIVGEDGEPAATGEAGEVWLRAPAAQRSYYGDPQASARVFQRGWTRMGDLGYLDRDGYLYLVGRDSDVIKSGGLKVSAPQVEAALREHPAVAEAAVLGVPHPVMGAMVAAAVVARDPVSADELRTFLHQRLARNEIPTRYAFVDRLPRNDLGKVVKGELRELFTAPRSTGGRPLETPEQHALARLWSAVLGLPVTSPDDDFFALGGDSLKAAQLATRAAVEFGVDVPGTLAFDHPVLSAQAVQVAAERPARSPVDPETAPAEGALSGVQEHWWRWMHATAETRHMPPVHVAVEIDGDLDADLLDRCLTELTIRHEALRTVFRDGRAVVMPESGVRLTLHEARDAQEAGDLAAELVRAPFDIRRGPLLRAALIRLRRGRTGGAAEPAAGGGRFRDCGPTGGVSSAVLVLAAHHMVFDGWSAGVLLRELGVLYSAFAHDAPSPLPTPSPYADFVAFEHREWHRTRDHWTATLAGAPRTLPDLPGRAPDVTRCAAIAHEFPVDPVRDLAVRRNATPAMVLAAAWAVTLGAWAGSPEVVLATPVTGRSRPEFDATVGCLFRWNLLRVPVAGDVIAHVRQAALTAGEHQFHNFARLHDLVPYPAYFRFESWGRPAHLPGLPSREFAVPAGPIMEWRLADDDPDTHPPELLVTEHPDGSLTGSMIYNRHAYRTPDMSRLATAFTETITRLT
ncbi:hypothetical protein Aph01nite_54780 [Acrocarpospora phusangensis]|uniref:Carrier domain-containing protein n=1 Tax=Acrocarpospora phusangensis TaxID=1070424 RepID=A0A919UR77_9ACTN|nr:class I adenylate-forming enzyme family protein [Acrocarpospora phusangensis]GIH27168.1 hypothetical protein Aph01nite_54780 [Acrocarpospora phusangensis]